MDAAPWRIHRRHQREGSSEPRQPKNATFDVSDNAVAKRSPGEQDATIAKIERSLLDLVAGLPRRRQRVSPRRRDPAEVGGVR